MIFSILIFVIFTVTLALTAIYLVRFPRKVRNITPTRKDIEKYKDPEKYRWVWFSLKAYKLLLICYPALILTVICFMLDKYPNEFEMGPLILGLVFGFSFVVFFIGFQIYFTIIYIKNGIIAFNRWGKRQKLQKVHNILNKTCVGVAFAATLCYSAIILLNAITIWFMIA